MEKGGGGRGRKRKNRTNPRWSKGTWDKNKTTIKKTSTTIKDSQSKTSHKFPLRKKLTTKVFTLLHYQQANNFHQPQKHYSYRKISAEVFFFKKKKSKTQRELLKLAMTIKFLTMRLLKFLLL